MTTTTEAERLLDLCLMTAYAARSAAAAQRAPCYQALLAELRRMAAVEAERDQLRAEVEAKRRQLAAAKTIVNCKDEQAAHIRREYGDLRAKAADVQGERNANAILTEQVERLEAENEALRRGECICKRCGLRQHGESAGPVPF